MDVAMVLFLSFEHLHCMILVCNKGIHPPTDDETSRQPYNLNIALKRTKSDQFSLAMNFFLYYKNAITVQIDVMYRKVKGPI